MATYTQDKETLLKWALAALMTINTSVLLWVAKGQYKAETRDVAQEKDIKKMEDLQSQLRADFNDYKREQRGRDNQQDQQNQVLIQAVLTNKDGYWQEKKRPPNREE